MMDAPERKASHSDTESSAERPLAGRAADPPVAGRAADPSVAERLEESFASRIEAFATAARRVRASSDADAIHDLRVATRRLVAALRVWRSLVPGQARRAAARSLRRLRRRIGRARELEVHVELLESRLPPRGTARAVAAAILLRLKGRLARRRRSAARRVSPRRARRVLRALGDAAVALRARLLRDPAAIQDGMAVQRELAAAARAAVREAAAQPEDTRLHEARIAVKKWRYALECLREAVPDLPARDLPSLRRMQAVLGEIHDLALLRDLIEKLAPEAGDERAPEALRGLVERLDGERRRAVRKFQRRAASLAGPSPDAGESPAGEATPPASEAPAAQALAAGDGPAAAQAADLRIANAADAPQGVFLAAPAEPEPDLDRAPPLDPREQRWERMASWLERAGRGG